MSMNDAIVRDPEFFYEPSTGKAIGYLNPVTGNPEDGGPLPGSYASLAALEAAKPAASNAGATSMAAGVSYVSDGTYWQPVTPSRLAQTRVKSVLINGGVAYVRVAWSATLDALHANKFSLAPSASTNSAVDHIGSVTIPIATANTEAAVTAAYSAGTALAPMQDSVAPIKYNDSNMGYAHGCPRGHTITAVAHGKTSADIGSVWSGAGRTFTILRIISADSMLLLSNNSGTLADWSFYNTTLAGVTLTHSSGATNTSSIVVTADVTLTQIYPGLNNRSVTLYVNDAVIDSSLLAIYVDCTFRIEEKFGIISPVSMLAYLQAAPGSGRTYYDDAIDQDVTVASTYRWQSNGCVSQEQSVTFNRAVRLNYAGVVQANPPTVGANTLTLYVPGVNAIAGRDYKAGNDITASAAVFDATTATWIDASNPPNRMAQVLSLAGALKHGIVLGYSPISNITTRRKRALYTTSAVQMLSAGSKKMYPTASNAAVTANEVRKVLAYTHIYNAENQDATVSTWVQDGDRVVVTVDFHKVSALTKIPLPVQFDGCEARVLDSQAVRLLQTTIVDGEGLSLACDATYGYAQILLSRV